MATSAEFTAVSELRIKVEYGDHLAIATELERKQASKGCSYKEVSQNLRSLYLRDSTIAVIRSSS